MLKKELSVARGIEKAELVLKNADIINVFTEAIEHADIAICNGVIVGIGEYEGEEEIDCSGKFAAPGFMDGHIHLESSMLTPVEFARAVLPHGTTSVITDPHEIANVCGMDGIEYMMEASKGLPLDVYFMLPSCVPSTSFDESGSVLLAKDLEALYKKENVLGLAEVMDYIGTIHGDDEIVKKISHAKLYNRVVDGHAPGLHGKDICAYVTAGIQSDHECVSIDEAKEKFSLGQWIMVREGTAAKNMDALMGLFHSPYHQRTMLVSDDKHSYDILEYGHIDDMLRRAVKKGADPCIAIKMATLNTATYFGIKNVGAIAPGYKADIVLISDLEEMKVENVIKHGKMIFNNQRLIDITEPPIDNEIINKVYNSFHCREMVPKDFEFLIKKDNSNLDYFRVIQLRKDEICTKEIKIPMVGGKLEILIQEDILKIAAIERHHNTNHIGLGYVNGYGLKKGAIASSVSHDAHNIIVIGTNEEDIARAANCIRDMQGGWAISLEGKIIATLPLPIAGLISDLDAVTLANKIKELKEIARNLGVEDGIDPFMTLGFVSLPVIPELRLITTGLFHVNLQRIVPLILERE
ncbi:MAG: adenine deaminase [Mobilitalea sp.]